VTKGCILRCRDGDNSSSVFERRTYTDVASADLAITSLTTRPPQLIVLNCARSPCTSQNSMENVRRTASRRSSRSRPDHPPLHRLLSSHHPDDHSVYHHEDGDGVHVRDDTSSLHKTETQRRDVESSSSDDESSTSSTKEKRNRDGTECEDETTYEEIRGGIPYEHDVEAGKPELEKKKSSRSIKDPNLVSLQHRKMRDVQD
jgi:hypothetical protein